MKKTLICSALVAGLLSMGVAHAGYNSAKSTNASASSMATTVAAAKANPVDDAPVRLTGKITKQLSDKKFLFKDDTGTIIVKIKEKYMPAKSFNENSTVRIDGKIDNDKFKPLVIEAKKVTILK